MKDFLIRAQKGSNTYTHFIGCPIVKNWAADSVEFISSNEVKKKKTKLCPKCKKMSMVVFAANNFSKENAASYQKFFDFVPAYILEKLFLASKGKVELVGNKMYLKSRSDWWYIDLTLFEAGDVTLWHNNYKVNARDNNNGMEYASIGYHEHKVAGQTAEQKVIAALKQVANYDHQKAQKAHQRNRKREMSLTISEMFEDELDLPANIKLAAYF